MFDIGMTELLVIGVVALIVVGPKDLPGMFRTVGRFTGKAKGMAREFQSAMNQAADEAGVKDVADDLKAATSKKGLGLDALDDVASKFEDWDPMTPEAKKTAAQTKAAEAKAKKAATAKAKTAASKTVTAKSTKPAAKPAAVKPKGDVKPKPAAKSKAAAKPKAATKPKAAIKPKAAAKPKAPAKRKAPAKPRASKPKPKTGSTS